MAPKFVRSTVSAMSGYVPGEQPLAGERIVKLNTNENPFPPSPKVMAAIAAVDVEMLRRYPDPSASAFRAAAAKLHDVAPEMILTGNGSDDILAMVTLAVLGPGDLLAYPDPTYSLYPVLAKLSEAPVAEVPWEKNWALPIAGLLAAKPRAVFLANPNAPTGTFVPPSVVAELAAKFDGLVLVDEAYADFAEDNCIGLVKKHENVVVARTLSKAYSLAGLRFGYAIAQPQVIAQIHKARDSYPCDAISIAAATAAIGDPEHARQSWQHIRAERARLAGELAQRGWTVLPSQANFILAACPDGRGSQMYLGLKRQGILVRYFDKPGLSDKLRITIGTSQENNALLAGIEALSGKEVLSSET